MRDDEQTPPPAATGGGAGGGDGGGRGWKIAAGVAVVAAVAAMAVLGSLLFFSGSSGSQVEGDVRACIPNRDFTKEGSGTPHDGGDECPPEGAEQTDGLVEKTSEGGFTIRVIEGTELGTTRELHVREPDRPYIDIAHAQTHAALGQPVRVYTERIDGQDAVVYMEDAPLLK